MSESDLENTSCGPHPLRFVAVHLGVGRMRDEEKSVEFAKRICEEIMLQTDKIKPPQTCSKCKVPRKDDITAETAVIQLVKKMEENPDLNCGLGSNLNMDGQVECDAGLMFSKTEIWTGVGAVSGCKNPVLFAKSLCDHQEIPRPLGLVQPNFLVGSGAKRWMREHCPELSVPDSSLISSRALSQYQKYKSNYDSAVKEGEEEEEAKGGPRKKQRQEDEVNLDTVGAIAVDHNYNFAAAVSSGGILLKHKGRMGQAAVPGGGCWAGDNVAVVTTGVGEILTRRLAARTVAENIKEFRAQNLNSDSQMLEMHINDDLDNKFNACVSQLFYHIYKAYKDPIGVLAVNTLWGHDGAHGQLYFHHGHNTESMCIGYMTREDATGHSIISKREHEKDDERPIVKTIVIPHSDSYQSI